MFIANLDPRALLYMYAQMEDRALETLRGASVDQLRVVLAMRSEINIEHWQAKVQEFLSGPVNSIDWNGFPGIVGNGAQTAPIHKAPQLRNKEFEWTHGTPAS